MVLINTVFLPGADAAVLRIKGSKKALAMTLDGNSLQTQLAPRTGGMLAVAEACRNLACVGARPIGVTNCLNFGNPEKPEVMGQFVDVIEGIAEACRAFEIPVTGGNVSFYNDTEGVSIYPTPVLGIVGVIPDIDKAVRPGFRSEGDAVVLLGRSTDELGASEYLKVVHGSAAGPVPAFDLGVEKAVAGSLPARRRGRMARVRPRPFGRRAGRRRGRVRLPFARRARLLDRDRRRAPRRRRPLRRSALAHPRHGQAGAPRRPPRARP